MKRLISLLVMIFIILAIPAVCNADITLIRDDAKLIDSQDIYNLESEASKFIMDYNTAMVIFTTDDLDGKTAKSFADHIYDTTYSGMYPDCVVFVISMEERDWCVRTFNGATTSFSDDEIDLVMYDVIPLLSDGNYAEAFAQYLTASYVCMDTKESSVDVPYEESKNNIGTNAIIAVVIGIAVAIIALLIMRHGMNTARPQSGASNYMIDGSFDLFRSHDLFLYSRTTKVRKQENSGSSSFRGSSGGSRSGRSGKF